MSNNSRKGSQREIRSVQSLRPFMDGTVEEQEFDGEIGYHRREPSQGSLVSEGEMYEYFEGELYPSDEWTQEDDVLANEDSVEIQNRPHHLYPSVPDVTTTEESPRSETTRSAIVRQPEHQEYHRQEVHQDSNVSPCEAFHGTFPRRAKSEIVAPKRTHRGRSVTRSVLTVPTDFHIPAHELANDTCMMNVTKLSSNSVGVSRNGSKQVADMTAENSTQSKHTPQGNSRRAARKSETMVYEEMSQCVRWFGHGKLWTIIAVSLVWLGTTFSAFARQSVNFVKLNEPLDVSPIYTPVESLGLVQIELCYNETISGQTGCQTIPLRTDEVNDKMYELARLFVSSSTVFGAFLSFFLTSAIFWETINLRPIGLGLLLTYFLQSFTMLFFDANVCEAHNCMIGTGCIFCIIAACCWICACIATAKMDAFKIRATRRRRRRAERRAKKALREAEKKILDREASAMTEKTASTSSDTSSEIEDPEAGFKERSDGKYEA